MLRNACLLLLAIGALSAPGRSPANAAETMIIDLTYDSVMDMVRPEVHLGLVVHHNLHIAVWGNGALSENRDRNIRELEDRNATTQAPGNAGQAGAYVSWKVATDGRLVRTQDDPQSTRTMIVTLMPGNSCRLEVMDQLKPGFIEYAFLRISTHTLGYFSSYRVISTSCNIH
jgi:hypothetical protein